MDFKETRCEATDRFHLDEDMAQWQAFVYTVMILWVTKRPGTVLTRCATISF